MKTMFEEIGVTYRREGDYLLPNLELPDQNDIAPNGKYGRMRLHYLSAYFGTIRTPCRINKKFVTL